MAQPALGRARLSVAAPHRPTGGPRRGRRPEEPPPLDWSQLTLKRGRFVVPNPGGGRSELTLKPGLEEKVTELIDAEPVPLATGVLLDVRDGRVLALAGRSALEENLAHKSALELSTAPLAPAASVFKLVTATALVESGVGPEARVCYHEGTASVAPSNLRPDPRDTECNSLAFGVAKSQNAILAKLAHEHLNPEALAKVAHALGFGKLFKLPFALTPSAIEVPTATLAFARTAAGFINTTLSPLHGAILAATFARGGVMPAPRLIERQIDRRGRASTPPLEPEERVLSADTARIIGAMMLGTTEYGTARYSFFDEHKRPLLPVSVAGKTGTLTRHQIHYSWFVGFAPVERPEVAVAVLLGHPTERQLRAHALASRLLSAYFPKESRAARR